MKKAVLFFTLVWLAFYGRAQQLPTDPATGKIMFSEVVTVEGATKKELHDNALAWVATAFNSGPGVLQLDTEDRIVIKGNTTYNINTVAGAAPSRLFFMATIEFKDGRYKYETTNFSDNGSTPIEKITLNPAVIYRKDGTIRAFNRPTVDALTKAMQDLNNDIKKGMVSNSKKSDW